MRHHTRKNPYRFMSLACALSLAVAGGLASTPAAWADDGGWSTEEDSEMMGGGGGMMGGGSMGGSGSIGSGAIGGTGGSGTNDSIDHVDKPWGQIIRIIPDRGMSALLFLPALPVLDDEGFLPGALQTLYLDRTYADTPNTWERVGVFEYDPNQRYYVTPEGECIRPIYTDEQWTEVKYCTVDYSSETIDYRDFYLRATAVSLSGGTLVETVFDPALIEYPKSSLPSDDEEPPAVVIPPTSDTGDSGGNRGGVGQGESERVDPSSSPKDLISESEESVENPLPLPLPGRVWAAQTENSAESASETHPDTNNDSDAAESTPEKKATSADTSAANEANASDNAAKEPTDEVRIPGFIWALGATGLAVAAGGLAFAFIRRR